MAGCWAKARDLFVVMSAEILCCFDLTRVYSCNSRDCIRKRISAAV